MQVTVTGKQIDVSEALRTHVSARLMAAVNKYFDRAIDGQVVFSRQAHNVRTDISVHAGAGILLQSHAANDDARASAEAAIDRIEKRLRRHKRRLRDHQQKPRADAEQASARAYVLEAEADDGGGGDAPVVIAETVLEVPTLSVGEAVMHLDLAEAPALLFRSAAHGGLNMVYRRADGNIGWVDPQLRPSS